VGARARPTSRRDRRRRWPTDDDYDGGDFDTFNEGRRRGSRTCRRPSCGPACRSPTPSREIARRLPAETIRSDAAWGWVHQVLHGHAIDHLTIIEPWTDQLRIRQVGNDPFGPDPAADARTLARPRRRFWAEDAAIDAAFREAIASVPDRDWTIPRRERLVPADHVAHLTGWFDDAAPALEAHAAGGDWAEMPPEGVDAYNERQVRAPAGRRRRAPAGFDAGLERLRRAVRAMRDDEWLDPEGFSWAYEDLHGHVRAHHAMIGPWLPARPGPPIVGRLRPDRGGSMTRADGPGGTGFGGPAGSGDGRADDRATGHGGSAARGPRPSARPDHRLDRGRLRRAPDRRRIAPRRHADTRSPPPRRTSRIRSGRPTAVGLPTSAATMSGIVDADGQPDVLVASHPSAARCPRWSPDGRQIAFVSRRRGWSQVHVVDAPIPRRGRPARDPKPPEPRALTATGFDVEDLVWSADGRLIATAVVPGPDFAVSEIHLVDVASGDERRVAGGGKEWACGPRPMPDGGFST
jgi:hypothetical protein